MQTKIFGLSGERSAAMLSLALALVCTVTPVTAQSLKPVPSNQDLFDLLKNPTNPPAARVAFPGLSPRPPLDLFPLDVNPLTLEDLLVDALTGAISFDLPATGVAAMDLGTGLAYNPVSGLPDRAVEPPVNQSDFIVDRTAAIRLGKALFWDMQVGSDGVQSCGSCHFHAGVDNRVKNQLNPDTLGGDNTLQVKGPNQTVVASDFPFHKLANVNTAGEPLLNPGNVTSDANDVMSSMGVMFRQFVDIPAPGPGAFIPGTVPPVLKPDIGNAVADPVGAAFQGLRRVEPRNTPTMHAATFNFNNFWDGRARHDFNGGSVFGASDPFAHIFVDAGSGLAATRELIRLSSVASLATGPALSNFEMSFDGRNWAKIAKKLLQAGVTPLANQLVSTTDSVLGPLSNQNATPGTPGLNVSYATLIEQAFGPEFWSNVTEHVNQVVDPTDPFDGVSLSIASGAADPTNTVQFTQKEANFTLFFGLAVQGFIEILVPDDSPFDKFHDANPTEFLGIVTDIAPGTPGVQVVGLSPRQLLGYDIFQGSNLSLQNPLGKFAKCSLCHIGPELTAHSISVIQGTMGADLITGAPKVNSGVFLEDVLLNTAATALELDNVNASLDEFGTPSGSALLDEGIYNIGVRPSGEDIARGGDDPFGFPLSLAVLSLQNQGFPVGVFSTDVPPVAPLPPHLAPFVNPFPLGGAFPLINQSLFIPDNVTPTVDLGVPDSGTFPNPNRVARNGSFKVPQLKNVELTGPYFHNGGMLTMRQVIDFYSRGGDFPVSNAEDRDVLMTNLNALPPGGTLTEAEKVSLVDFMLAQTDDRVKFERAPFDHPEVIIPVDGTAPDNNGGRAVLLADARFLRVAEVGAAGRATPLPNFLGISSVEGSPGVDHFDAVTVAPPSGPTVTITAKDNTATERNTTTGTFRVARTGSLAASLKVFYTVSGTAASGSDYTALSGSVTIPRGDNAKTFQVKPINDRTRESTETVIATLSPNAAYTVGAPNSATVNILDND